MFDAYNIINPFSFKIEYNKINLYIYMYTSKFDFILQDVLIVLIEYHLVKNTEPMYGLHNSHTRTALNAHMPNLHR